MVEPFVSKRDKTASEEAIRKEKGMARLKRVGVNRNQEANINQGIKRIKRRSEIRKVDTIAGTRKWKS